VRPCQERSKWEILLTYLTRTEDDRDLGSVEVVRQLFIDTALYLHVDHSILPVSNSQIKNRSREKMSSLSGARAIHFPSEADEPLSVVPGFHAQQKPVVGPAQFVAQCVTILECLIKESSHGTIPAERPACEARSFLRIKLNAGIGRSIDACIQY
jgi:hypothetical protein